MPMTSVHEVSDTDGSQPVTVAQIFGMFLVLQICLLAQSPGSLLNVRHGGSLWRSNPIGALVETLIIVRHLMWAAIRYWAGRLFRPWEGGQAGTIQASDTFLHQQSFGQTMQLHIAAVLLLRSSMSTDVRYMLFEVTSLLARLIKSKNESKNPDVPPQRETQIDSNSDSNADPGSSFELRRPEPAAFLHQQQQPQNSPLPAFCSDPEDSQSLSSFTTLQQATSKLIADELFKSQAFVPREWTTNAVATLAALSIAVKLYAMQGVMLFKAMSIPLLLSWIVLQSIQSFQHACKMTEKDKQSTITIACDMRYRLKKESKWWSAIFIILHLPLSTYLDYISVYRSSIIQQSASFRDAYTTFLMVKILFYISLVVRATPVSSEQFQERLGCIYKETRDVVVEICRAASRELVPALILATFLAYMVTVLISATAVLKLTVLRFSWMRDASEQGLSEAQKLGISPKFDNVVIRMETTWRVGGGLMMNALMVHLWMHERNDRRGSRLDRFLLSASNVMFAFGVLAWYLMVHDETTAVKPAWTDWLG